MSSTAERTSGHLDRAVIVAVVAVNVVQMPIYEVVDVIAVRDGGVAASGPVDVVRIVAGAAVRGAVFGILGRYRDRVLIVMILVRAVQMAVVQVADVVLVLDGHVTAVRPVRVGVIFMDFVCHGFLPRGSARLR